MEAIVNCEVCGNGNLESVLDLGSHPLCDDLVPFDSERKCREYPIEILFCKVCNTAHQRFQVPKKELFTKDYHYRARMTGSVLVGMSDLVDNCEKRFGPLQGKSVLDVGCNDGSLLNFFAQKGCRTMGVEPTGAAAESSHRTLNAFFDRESALAVRAEIGEPDFITFTNVFAHIEDLAGLIANLRLLIGRNTVVVIENHYLGDIFRRGQFDTFYHEHPRTYSLKSFEFIAASLGLNLLAAQFVSRYGGNIRVFLGHGAPGKVEVDESGFGTAFAAMAADLGRWRVQTRRMIEDHVAAEGKLRAKAFPGRAAILIKLLDLDESHLSAVYEIKGSIKVGHYVPGTRIPILPEAELFELDKTRPILNLAWHIPSEVRANLESHGYIGKVIDIKSV
jgi:SAM-dependent methyltransferase